MSKSRDAVLADSASAMNEQHPGQSSSPTISETIEKASCEVLAPPLPDLETLRASVEQSANLIIITDIKGNIEYVNQAFEKTTGYTAAEVIGKTPGILKSGEQTAEFYRNLWSTIGSGKTWKGEFHNRRKDGSLYWDATTITPLLNVRGETVRYLGIKEEITEQKLAAVEMAESENRFAQLAEQSRTFIWEVDAYGLYTYANPVAETILGYLPCELVGHMHFYDIHPEKERQEFRDAAFKVFEARGAFNNLENSAVTKDGRTVWVSTNGIPVLNEDGSLRGYRGSDKDITERKKAEDLLRESETRLTLTLEAVNDGLWDWNVLTGTAYFSPKYYTMLGYYTGEFPATFESWRALVHPEDIAKIEGELKESIETGNDYMADIRMKSKSGYWVWISTRGKVVAWDANGKASRMMGTHSDITDRKRVAETLLTSSERLALAVEAGRVGIWDYNIANNRLVWDDQMFRLYGITREQFSGAYEAWTSGVHPEDRVRVDAEFQMAIRGGKDFNTEFRVLWPDGSTHTVRAIAKVARDAAGVPLRLVGTNWDITKEKQVEASMQNLNRQLAEATERAERATAAKSEFLATITHELRNPLTGVLGFAEILADSPLNEEQQSYAESIRESGNHLLSLINDILDFSSIEKGALMLNVGRFELAGLIKLSSDIVQKSAKDKGLEFRCEVSAGVPELADGDERRIRQILINLLANAVKFTSSGTVVLRVAPAENFLAFSIEDTGIGISSEAIARLFQLFTQADSTINQKYGGTGIGLAVSQRLAKAMGGTLSVVSSPGKGSTFTLRLPLEAPSKKIDITHALAPALDTKDVAGLETAAKACLSVLVVEDDRSNSMMVGKMLQTLGYLVEFAVNGAEAVEAFAPGKYLAILMDLRMPVMNGFDAVKIIRSRESGTRTPIVALTANVVSGSRELYLAAGIDAYLPKPFKREELKAALAKIAGVRQ